MDPDFRRDDGRAPSLHAGEVPDVHVWGPGGTGPLDALEACLRRLWGLGYRADQVAVVSFRGVQQSLALQQAVLGGVATRRATRQYDAAGNPVWTAGELLVDSVYRFKGQSAPAVVLCDVDFTELTERECRKLFVGLTRGQVRVDVVMGEGAAAVLAGRLG